MTTAIDAINASNAALQVLQLLPIFLIGLVGSVHCIGMCGGIVGALSSAPGAQSAPQRVIPIATTLRRQAGTVLAYNAGRIASYMAAGALAGGLASGAYALTRIAALQVGAYWLANLMLVALGLYLMGVWHGLAHLEAGGQLLWRRVQPWTKALLPMDHPLKAFALGGLWGWLPCGMVYSVLLTALLSGSAPQGALVMLAFGLGTLPTLIALGMLGARLRQRMQQRIVRIACGALVLSFGALGLLRASSGVSLGWLDALCLTPHP
jgi:sulfite exporter TauE/SafE